MSLRMSPRKQIDRIAGNRHRLCTKRPTGLESLATVADLADYGWCKCGAHSVHSEVIYVGVDPDSAGGSNTAKSCPAEGFRTGRFVRQVDESSPEVIGAECPPLSDSGNCAKLSRQLAAFSNAGFSVAQSTVSDLCHRRLFGGSES